MIARANAEIETAARTRARWIAIAHLARSRRLSLSTDKANVVRSRSSAIERASRNEFYSNRRACFLVRTSSRRECFALVSTEDAATRQVPLTLPE
jgi:hypothetical protein